jgi:hypothetical protein
MSKATSTVSAQSSIDVADDYDRFISQQVTRTGIQVRWTDLATRVVELLSGIIGFLLIAILIDHWIVDLGIWGRTAAFCALVTGTSVFVVTRVVPYLVRRINPMYAARTLERSTPTLRNSLINFLFLRTHPEEVRPAVYEEVRHRAAADLSNVPVDSAVDRDMLIRFGYVLAVLVLFAGIYQVLSPKDPLLSVARIAMPWKRISRPSRVQIVDVAPGDTEIYRGQTLDVAAQVRGVAPDIPVILIYGTHDGQLVDVAVEMAQDGDRDMFRARIGDSETGLQQGIRYRISAGDAVSTDFRVSVVEAPNIVVRQVDYEFPVYTGQSPESRQSGDISALEGTRVTVRASANQPIRSAHIEFFPPEETDSKGPQTLRMSFDDQEATAAFLLSLQPDRKTPAWVGYQIHFTNRNGQKSQQPVRHSIDVIPDLAPHVEILSPAERDTEIPENGSIPFEVRAIDPDFQLEELTLEAVSGGQHIAHVRLLEQLESGQVNRKFMLRPAELGLRGGDIAVVWASAKDNRQSADSKTAANVSRTENYRVRIVAADPQLPVEDQTDASGKHGTESPDSGSQPEAGDKSKSDGQQKPGSENGKSSNSGTPAEPSDQQGKRKPESPADQQADGQKAGDSDSEETSPAAGQSGDEASGKASESDSQQSKSDSRQSGTDPPSEGDPSSASKPDETAEPGEKESTAGGNQRVESDGSEDSDAFQRILDHARDTSGSDRPDPTARPSTEEQSDGTRDKQSKDSSASEPSASRREAGSDATQKSSEGDAQRPDQTERQSNASGQGQPNDQQSEQNLTGQSPGEKSQQRASPAERSTQAGSVDDAAEKPAAADSRQSKDRTQEPDHSSSTAEGDKDKNASSTEGDKDKNALLRKANADSSDAGSSGDPRRREASGDAGGKDAPQSQASDVGKTASDKNSKPPSDGSATDSFTKDQSKRDALSQDSQSPRPEGQSVSGQSSDPTANGGNAPNGASGTPEAARDGQVMKADDPNLEYARKATDVALQHLKNEVDNREFLDKLGWTSEEARAFLKRWEQMKSDAQKNDPRGQQARRELDDYLRGLGLRPKDARLRRNASIQRDSERRVSETARQSKPPAEYADQYRAYLKQTDVSPDK